MGYSGGGKPPMRRLRRLRRKIRRCDEKVIRGIAY